MRVELQDIHKHFGLVRANDGINLLFEEGKIYGLLGENGAGKSTLMKILSGYQPPDSGQILLDGTVEVEVLDDEACAPAELEPEGPIAKGTSYVRFAAFGAGAAVELAALAQRHEGVRVAGPARHAARHAQRCHVGLRVFEYCRVGRFVGQPEVGVVLDAFAQ